ncbi:ATP-grasp fold amidoligase family protein [Aeromicrobium sp.]|uniref:ATP-grasp fold amidoligase family protein n=1 Tax=Aeromicrobium sp. TaxID=1871063 RepID=UPI003D6A71D7
MSRRDERIAQLTRKAAELDESVTRLLDRPSFQVRLHEERRLRALEAELGAPGRSIISGGKFHVYDFVRSHGVDVPEQTGRWDDPADIPWDDLPGDVVIKSAFGSTSRGVLPLRRVDGGWHVGSKEATVTSEQLTADLAVLAAERKARPPFAAEERLYDTSGGPPIDVKIYSFYGEAPVVLLRRVDAGDGGQTTVRLIDDHGADLSGSYIAGKGKPTDPTIPVPGALVELVEVAKRVSVAIRVPFSRIDLYDVRGRVVFGEVTPRPGMSGRFAPDLDVALGEAWERAQVRLWRDIAEGMSPKPEWGSSGAAQE